MSESKKIAAALQSHMIKGRRYLIGQLIALLPDTDYEFSPISWTEIPTEPGRPRWNRWVRNAVRNSPGRTDHEPEWWTDLKAEWIGPKKTDWEYWIEEHVGHEANSPELGRSERPMQNDGWLAEQKVWQYLAENGYDVFDVSREGVGYDLLARKGDEELFVEVKSSTSSLSITLTKNEWVTAKKNRDKYRIAYYENFTPETEQEPNWIIDPAKMVPKERQTIEYSLPRDQWDL